MAIEISKKYQVMPDLSEDEYAALRADIEERGVQVPVELDDEGNILDGFHRVRACEELGIKDYPTMVRYGMTEDGKRTHARQLNLARRHLSSKQKRELIAEQLKETPEKSDRQIANDLDVDGKTVGSVRTELESTAEIPQLDETVGADGRVRPRKTKKEPKKTAFFSQDTKETEKTLGVLAAVAADEEKKEKLEQGKISIAGLDKQIKKEQKVDNDLDKKPLSLPDKTYQIIYADPPWPYKLGGLPSGGVDKHYKTMTFDEINEMKVSEIAAPNSFLFLWATFPHLKSAFEVIEAWGFQYKTLGFSWVKINKRQDLQQTIILNNLIDDIALPELIDDAFGVGQYAKSNAEVCLLCIRGDTKELHSLIKDRSVRSTVFAHRGEHSAKPPEVRKRIEQLLGDLPRIELFAREKSKGWDVWGLEVECDIEL